MGRPTPNKSKSIVDNEVKIGKAITKKAKETRKAPKQIWSLPPLIHEKITPHTLVLGSMQSNSSTDASEYYKTNGNAFWKLAGDAFGFEQKDPYPHRANIFTSNGFAIWNVLGGCVRFRSMEKDVVPGTKAPNDVKGLMDAYTSIKRIAFESKCAANDFLKGNRLWVKTPSAFHCGNDFATEIFGKAVTSGKSSKSIELLVLHGTSGNNSIDYTIKQKQWLEECYNTPKTAVGQVSKEKDQEKEKAKDKEKSNSFEEVNMESLDNDEEIEDLLTTSTTTATSTPTPNPITTTTITVDVISDDEDDYNNDVIGGFGAEPFWNETKLEVKPSQPVVIVLDDD